MKSDVRVVVEPGVKFDRTGASAHAIRFTGSAASFRNTIQHKTRGDTLIEMASIHDFVVGDFVQIVGQRNALSIDAGDWRCGNGTASLNYAYFGEWLLVAEVPAADEFRSAIPLIFPDYRVNDNLETDTDRTRTQVRKMSPITNAHWLGGEFINSGNWGVCYGLYSVGCTFQKVIINRGDSPGGSVQWDKCYRCEGIDVDHANDAALDWDYDLLHGKLNRFKTISSQECGFTRCYDEFGGQSFDLTYGGSETPYLVNVRSFVEDCETRGCFEGVTSHPGCFQEKWANNRFLECVRAGIVVRGLEPTVANNLITSSTELLTIADATQGTDYSVGVDLYNGYTQGAHIHGNKVFGFRYAFRVRDGSTDSRYTNVDALIENNMVSECYGGMTTAFSETVVTDTVRGIVYQGNSHRRMQRYMVNLGAYSPGVDIQGNVLHGDFVNASDDSSVYAIIAGQNCPALTIENNRWYRTAAGNTGKTLRMVNIGSIADVTTFPSATWAKRTKLRNNIVMRSPTSKYTVNNSAYQQNDDFSDADTATTYGALGALFSGEYTPTLTNVTNVASSTAEVCQYIRMGPLVFVFGTVQIDAVTGGSQFALDMSLPIASNFADRTDAAGSFVSSAADASGRIYADTSDDRVILLGVPTSNANLTYGFSFSYRII
tara:strand:- start:14240 stop:16216 length:1977 start_codon:yes stop_codon:yes gene_type:complete